MILKHILIGAMAFAALPLLAGTAPIGVATSIGSVTVNDTVVSGTANLTDGSRLETTSTPTEVHLASGADLRLATRSAGSVFADHLTLDEGAVRVGNFNGFTVDAAQLQISSDEAGAKAIVRMNKKTVEIASIGGSVTVLDSGLLTRVAAGTKMSFQQSGGSPDQNTANSSTTGANPAPAQRRMPSDQKTFLWVIGITAVAALAIGLTAAAEGKSPF